MSSEVTTAPALLAANAQGSRMPAPADLTFILDTPASTDRLDVHAPVAKAITQVIRTRKSVKMIGLLGGWGSGKSTVARLARDQLEAKVKDEPNLHCFTFDAWVHQSDPPRLAFLGALADFLETDEHFSELQEALKDLTKPHHWRTKFDNLKVQAEKTTTKTAPTLTAPGRWLALALVVAAPVGFKLLGDGTLGALEQRDLASWFIFVIAWVAALAPGAVLLFFYLNWRRWSEFGKLKLRDFLSRHRDEHKDDSLLSVVDSKNVEIRHEVRHKTLDPSAIEFQDAFRDMVAAAHTPERRLVIIVDNLDRLPPSEAKIFWSTVRSLFLGTDAGRAITREDLPTVIMPIDAGSIEKMYDGAEGKTEKLGRSFLEKTFDLTFYVPAPVLSRWHRYLYHKLTEVFGKDLPADWPPLIGALYERHLGEALPTPRGINGFVNAMAVLWLQREDDPIHIGIIAYFVMIRDNLVDEYDKTLRMDVEELFAFDPEWRTAIAALYYGLTREDAEELTMDDPIRSALIDYDAPRFRELFARPGFDRYFMRVLETSDVEGRALPVLGTAWLLSQCAAQPWTPTAWRRLRALVGNISQVTLLAEVDSVGLSALLASATGVERARLHAGVIDALGGYRDSALAGEGVARFVLLAQVALDAAPLEAKDRCVNMPGQARDYCRLLGLSPSLEVLKGIRPPGGDDAVRDYLAELLGDIVNAKYVGRLARTFATVAPDSLDWAPLVQVIGDALQSPDEWRATGALNAITLLYKAVDLVADRQKEWRDDGRLSQAFNTVWSGADKDGVANIIALMIAAEIGFTPPSDPSWASRLEEWPDLPELAEAVLEGMGWSLNVAGLLVMGASPNADAPLNQALALHALRVEGGEGLDLQDFFRGTEKYVALPGDLQQQLWGSLAGRPDFWKGLAEQPASVQRLVYPSLMKHLKSRSQLGKAVATHLNAVEAAEWVEAVRNGVGAYSLIEALAASMPHSQARLGEKAFRGLHDAVPGLEGADDVARGRWFAIAGRLEDALRQTLYKTLAAALPQFVGRPELFRILDLGGSDLAVHGLGSMPDQTLVQLVIPLAGQGEGRAWLAAHVEHVEDWVRRADPGSRATLRAILEGAPGDASVAKLLAAFESGGQAVGTNGKDP